ncbi:MAG: NADH:ubiquinone reductase (Na(+)-transporting) subunit A, partial [Rikenellaceae bacterium]
MSKNISLRKGLDIKLVGEASKQLGKTTQATQYAISPLDFESVAPKLLVKVGDKVDAGSPLFYNKENNRIIFTSPVSGTVSAINRGEKRKILNVVVDADATLSYKEFAKVDPKSASREEVIDLLLESGLWAMIIQRPYGVIANPADSPKSIFISTFDSSPLAPDYNFALSSDMEAIQKGIEVMAALTPGSVNLGVNTLKISTFV